VHQFFVFSKKGDVVRITGEDAHHIIRVLRLKTGEEIFVVVGRGERFKGEIWKFKDNEVLVKLKEKVKIRFEPNLPLSIAQSLPKGRKFEEVIKTCTELGVIEFFPIISERTIVKVRKEKIDRWRRIAKEEAMLSKRDIIPEVHEVEMAKEHGFVTIGLGNRILRAEVAPVVISSLIFFKSGDLG